MSSITQTANLNISSKEIVSKIQIQKKKRRLLITLMSTATTTPVNLNQTQKPTKTISQTTQICKVDTINLKLHSPRADRTQAKEEGGATGRIQDKAQTGSSHRLARWIQLHPILRFKHRPW